MPRTFALSIHADYRCARSGACCTAGWAIPVEPCKQAAFGAAVLVPGDDGACRFFDRTTSLCVVQRDSGEDAMPDSCRHFPRITLVDDRGIHVTLSHFCPTAARQLFRADVPLAIVESPPAFPVSREYEGLDARGQWPPLVRPTLLFDLDAYTAWERFAVNVLATGSSERALLRLADLAERLRKWRPDDGPMSRVVEAPGPGSDETLMQRYRPIAAHAYATAFNAVPMPLRDHAAAAHNRRGDGHDDGPPAATDPDRVICRYLAARAFASWTAYQSRGVRTIVAELVLARALVQHFAWTRSLFAAIRETDRLLVHLVDRDALMSTLGGVEAG